ncbi:MAG: CopG family transcriptional regulator [Oscillatoriales cyanobacterium CG2_30_44_21]|nr:MAG: CopG family transcriptional regulator [Oscillatoriales cyanobacterium CG2_30_44_21]
MNAKEFDRKFDDGEEDIIEMLDLSKAKRPFATQKRLSIDLPIWMIELIDREANRLGVTPQTIIQTSLAKHLATSKP